MFSSDPRCLSVTGESPTPDGRASESLKWRKRSCSLGLLLMSPESSLCSQAWQSPQETAGLKCSLLSQQGSRESDVGTVYLLCVHRTFSLANSALRGWFSPFYLYDLQTGNSISSSVFTLTIIYSNKTRWMFPSYGHHMP